MTEKCRQNESILGVTDETDRTLVRVHQQICNLLTELSAAFAAFQLSGKLESRKLKKLTPQYTLPPFRYA